MRRIQYSWKKGTRIGAKAQDFGRIVARLEKNNGVARPEDVVEQARPKKSPIHDAFEWEDSIAAEKYRIEQARHNIRMLIVTVENAGTPPFETRAFVNVVNDDQKGYVTTATAMADDDMAEQVLREIQARIGAARISVEKLRRLRPQADERISTKALDDLTEAVQKERGLLVTPPVSAPPNDSPGGKSDHVGTSPR